MKGKILFVDDDENILAGFSRQFGDVYDMTTAGSGKEALECAAKDTFTVIVSDFKMPAMNGVELLMAFRQLYPDTIRIMLTGQADMESIVDVINDGNIFRFLTKPCSSEQIKKNVDDAMAQYTLVASEKELLSRTLTGAIQVMADMLVLAKPIAFSRSIRIRDTVRMLLSEIHIENGWQVEIAAMLSQLGCVTIPDNILTKVYKNLPVAPEHKAMFDQHIKTSSDIIAKIPRLKKVAEIIDGQSPLLDSNGSSYGSSPIETRILKIALDFDQLLMMDKTKEEAIALMRMRKDRYDPAILDLLARKTAGQVNKRKYVQKKVAIEELTEDMVLSHDIISTSGIIIGEKRQWINKTLKIALANYAQNGEIGSDVDVLVNVIE